MFDYWFKYRSARDALKLADEREVSLREQNSELRKKLQTAHGDLEFANTEKNKQAEEISKLKREVKTVREKLRDQTGADLLVNALIELGVVPKPEKDYDAHATAGCLQGQMNANREALRARAIGQQQGSGLSDLLGGAIR